MKINDRSDRVQLCICISKKMRKWIDVRAARTRKFKQDLVEEALLVYMLYLEKADLEIQKKKDPDCSSILRGIAEIQESLYEVRARPPKK